MFTLRFIRHDGSCRNLSVATYDVSRDEDRAGCTMSMKLGGDDPVRLYVGKEEEYRIGYVTNPNGRTIDSIKPLEGE